MSLPAIEDKTGEIIDQIHDTRAIREDRYPLNNYQAAFMKS